MKKIEQNLVKKLLGDDIFDVLKKNGIYKINTGTVTDTDDMKVGLQIVPRAILSFLIEKLRNLEVNKPYSFELPFTANARVELVKHGSDNYSGDIIKDNIKVSTFKYRSIPSLGLLILSTFELYDVSILQREEVKEVKQDTQVKLQELIDERIRIRDLVEQVVDKKLSQRDAIKSLIREKIHAFLTEKRYEDSELVSNSHYHEKQELEEEKNILNMKRQMLEHLDGVKSNTVCESCDSVIHKSGESFINCCICYGEFRNKKIQIKKNNNGKCSFKFPNKFGAYNIEVLLNTIKKSGEK